MQISTKFNIGNMVIAKSDGNYEPAKVVGIQIYLDDSLSERGTWYRVNSREKLLTVDHDIQTWITHDRVLMHTEAELLNHYALYTTHEALLTDEQRELPRDKRDELILWNMRQGMPAKATEKEKEITS
jgi:hypothetical protein